MTETPTIVGLQGMVNDAIPSPRFGHKPIFVLNEFGELHRIIGIRWSEDNDCFLLMAVTDE